MRPRTVLAVLAMILAPTVTLAQAEGPEGEPAAPRWSLGAGVSLFTSFVSGAAVGGIFDGTRVAVPIADASLERRLSERTWLVVGLAGVVTRENADVPPNGVGFSRDDTRGLAVTAGLRRAVTPSGAPVEVSLLLLGEGGIADADLTFVSTSTDGSTEQSAELSTWSAGASAGIAVDRVLTGSLSLRVASPLVRVLWSFDQLSQEGQPERESDGFALLAGIAPRLELRLAF